MRDIAEAIDALEFDTVFTLTGNGARVIGVMAPEVANDPETDVQVSDGWECLTGMTNQSSYSGAVMHTSERIGVGIAERLFEIATDAAEDGQVAQFAIVLVYEHEPNADGEHESIGWAIAYRTISE